MVLISRASIPRRMALPVTGTIERQGDEKKISFLIQSKELRPLWQVALDLDVGIKLTWHASSTEGPRANSEAQHTITHLQCMQGSCKMQERPQAPGLPSSLPGMKAWASPAG